MHRDAFCSECRGPLDETPAPYVPTIEAPSEVAPVRGRHVSEYFTIPGRMLVLSTLVLAFGGPWLVVHCLHDVLPSGSYPLWFFFLPIWIVLAILFFFATVILRHMRIQVFRDPNESQRQAGE
jgi:hypothetical protein